jgi:hypothetical protein
MLTRPSRICASVSLGVSQVVRLKQSFRQRHGGSRIQHQGSLRLPGLFRQADDRFQRGLQLHQDHGGLLHDLEVGIDIGGGDLAVRP